MQRFNSIISVKRKWLSCGHYDYAFSKGRCKSCSTVEDALKRLNEEDEKDENLSDLIKECDDLFSKYIRLKYADNKGNVKCYTCDNTFSAKDIQCGHYISRYSMYLRFDERNVRPQCEDCNCRKKGNLLVFGKRLEEEKQGITEILYEESKMIYKYSRDELRNLIYELRRKIAQLKY